MTVFMMIVAQLIGKQSDSMLNTAIALYEYQYIHAYCSDCLRFSFMDYIQKELDEAEIIWNTHLIRAQNGSIINGIPNELYHLSEVRGKPCTEYKLYNAGSMNHICTRLS